MSLALNIIFSLKNPSNLEIFTFCIDIDEDTYTLQECLAKLSMKQDQNLKKNYLSSIGG